LKLRCKEINEKRQELLARESQLKEIEARMHREQSHQMDDTNGEVAA
jgi:cell division control protein 11